MATERPVRLARMFCSAHDRNVPVLLRTVTEPAPSGGSTRSPLPEAIACLDYGTRCTGWLCPHFAVPALPPKGLIDEAIAAARADLGKLSTSTVARAQGA